MTLKPAQLASDRNPIPMLQEHCRIGRSHAKLSCCFPNRAGPEGRQWEYSLVSFVSAVRTARPATRPAHSFLELRAYTLNVLSSGFRFLDGDGPADPFIAREWRNILPFCPRGRVVVLFSLSYRQFRAAGTSVRGSQRTSTI